MRQRTPATAATALALTLLATACGGAGEVEDGAAADLDVSTGVTDDSVVIGTHMPLTGPAAPGYSQIPVGAGAVFDYVNANGGVHGRTIDYRVEDDAYDPTRTIEVTRDLVLSDEVFAMLGGLGTPTHSKVIDYLNDEGVPDLFVSSGALMWNQPETYPLSYGYQVDYTKEAKIQGAYIAEHFPDAEVGYFHQNDDVGVDSQAGLDQYLADQVVAVESYESGVTDIGPQIAALERAGADLVVCSCVPTYTALALLEAAGIGYEAQFVASSIGADTATLEALLGEFAEEAGADVPPDALIDGLISTGYLPQVGTDDAWVELYTAIYEEYGGEAPLTNTTLYGMVQATLFVQVLEAAGQDLTRQSLIDALGSREWAGPGLVPFVASEDDHSGYTGAYVSQYRAGEQPETLQEPRVTDSEGGDIEEFEMERPEPQDIPLFAHEP
jgi:ABC-type branched-subunit amino acid transport system substrate-binding protein